MNLTPTENEECETFVEFLELQKNLGNIFQFSHISNETPAVQNVGTKANGKPIWKKNFSTLKRLHNLGVRRGIPDYIIVISTGNICFVEMKRLKGSTTLPEQKEWIHDINLCNNSEARICKGASEAIKFIEEFFPCRGNLKF